ncbi:hypothetical protein BSKO_06114 [Bryopsis sp. KO-2023]|nr:hypothetical protein BSKO_06114 [Bryopsis sp. KO-2023]
MNRQWRDSNFAKRWRGMEGNQSSRPYAIPGVPASWTEGQYLELPLVLFHSKCGSIIINSFQRRCNVSVVRQQPSSIVSPQESRDHHLQR